MKTYYIKDINDNIIIKKNNSNIQDSFNINNIYAELLFDYYIKNEKNLNNKIVKPIKHVNIDFSNINIVKLNKLILEKIKLEELCNFIFSGNHFFNCKFDYLHIINKNYLSYYKSLFYTAHSYDNNDENLIVNSLSGCIFNDCLLNNVYFEGVNLNNSTFINCDLSDTNFSDCSLKNTKFINCDLSNANFWQEAEGDKNILSNLKLDNNFFIEKLFNKENAPIFSYCNLTNIKFYLDEKYKKYTNLNFIKIENCIGFYNKEYTDIGNISHSYLYLKGEANIIKKGNTNKITSGIDKINIKCKIIKGESKCFKITENLINTNIVEIIDIYHYKYIDTGSNILKIKEHLPYCYLDIFKLNNYNKPNNNNLYIKSDEIDKPNTKILNFTKIKPKMKIFLKNDLSENFDINDIIIPDQINGIRKNVNLLSTSLDEYK